MLSKSWLFFGVVFFTIDLNSVARVISLSPLASYRLSVVFFVFLWEIPIILEKERVYGILRKTWLPRSWRHPRIPICVWLIVRL